MKCVATSKRRHGCHNYELWCDLEYGHKGPHYDGIYRREWSYDDDR